MAPLGDIPTGTGLLGLLLGAADQGGFDAGPVSVDVPLRRGDRYADRGI